MAEPAIRGRVEWPGPVPELSVEGPVEDAGCQLGEAWRRALAAEAATRGDGRTPWWRDRRYSPLMERLCPHLPELYRAMARGAGVPEDRVATRAPAEGGCTSFALAPAATLEGVPISGQTKDVSRQRGAQFQVLRLRLTDGPSALTLTYPGWLFGHGFVAAGCALFRNSLYVEGSPGGMPYAVWGTLALHCPSVEEVMRLTRDHRVDVPFHVTVADEAGGIAGIEHGRDRAVFLEATDGVYVHANAVRQDPALRAQEREDGSFRRADSLVRDQALSGRLVAERGRLTAPLCYAALCDHTGYPTSVCRHQSDQAMTSAVVIAEPTRRRLHVARGPACQHWPRTHSLEAAVSGDRG